MEQAANQAAGQHNPSISGRKNALLTTCGSSMPTEGYSVFFREWLAGGKLPNQLPISAVCNSRCIFCSNDMNPFPVAKGIFRDIEDVKLQLALMAEQYRGPIRLSDSLPGRIAEGEAFLNPKFFEILRLIRRKFPANLLCFTTNGSMLDESFIKELSRFRPVEITLSMHSARHDLWAAIFGKDESAAAKAIHALQRIKPYNMDLVGTIVPLPGICGWQDLEDTYGAFVSRGAKSMILYWPGYSRCSPSEAVQMMKCPLGQFEDFVDRMRDRHGIPVVAFPSMRGELPVRVAAIVAATGKGNPGNLLGPYRKVLWLTSEAVHERISREVDKEARTAGNIHAIRIVRNETYGGNIITAGLLMVDDFVKSGQEALRAHPDAELVLVPKAAFDGNLCDLKGNPAYRIAEELERPVWVVSNNGDIHRLLERVFERRDDSPTVAVQKVMEQFNLAWKDNAAIDASLDLVDEFPIKTPWGLLSREELRRAIFRSTNDSPGGAGTPSRTFKLLGVSHALCMEKWPGNEKSRAVERWTFLLKKEDWRIDYISQSAMEDAPCA